MSLLRFLPALLFLLPELAWSADGQPGVTGFSMLASFLQMGLALIVVVGLILVTYYAANRLMKTMPAFRPGGQHIRVVEVRPMGPRKSLMLIEVSGEYLLLASSDNNISLIKQIDMLEEIEVVDEPSAKSSFLSFLNRATKTGA